MKYDGRLLAAAREDLDEIRQANESERLRRQRLIYSGIPEIAQIESKMRSQMSEVVHLTVSRPPDLSKRLDALREENLQLQADKAELLVGAGYSFDFLDPIYSCSKCNDTGSLNGSPCECLRRLYNRRVTESLSSLLLNGNESFENINLSLYPDEYDPGLQTTVREFMSAIFDECRKYADEFSSSSGNLLLQGGTGLGKTYLCACIAGVVSKKGFSVCYETVSAAFEAFERQKFKKDPADSEAADNLVNRILDCDLMILDDLGTEMTTAFSNSALYTLINTRIVRSKPTIINTNLTDEVLMQRYTEQICSRIQGSFEKLPFFGIDIRRQNIY